jgi:hypothetical protein
MGSKERAMSDTPSLRDRTNSVRDVRMARRYLALHQEPAGGWKPEDLMQGAEVPDWGITGELNHDPEYCAWLLATALDSYREVPADNFPKDVGPGGFDLTILRLAAESYNRGMIHPDLELKPWVVLTLLDAYEELEAMR